MIHGMHPILGHCVWSVGPSWSYPEDGIYYREVMGLETDWIYGMDPGGFSDDDDLPAN